MELTWPIDVYCWVVRGSCGEWCCNDVHEIDKQICLSTAPDKDCFAYFCLHGKTPKTILVSCRGNRSRKYDICKYLDDSGDFILDTGSDKFIKYKHMQSWLDKSAKIESGFAFERGSDTQNCVAGQRIIAAVRTLPMPIADEIIMHLRGSIRATLAEIG